MLPFSRSQNSRNATIALNITSGVYSPYLSIKHWVIQKNILVLSFIDCVNDCFFSLFCCKKKLCFTKKRYLKTEPQMTMGEKKYFMWVRKRFGPKKWVDSGDVPETVSFYEREGFRTFDRKRFENGVSWIFMEKKWTKICELHKILVDYADYCCFSA